VKRNTREEAVDRAGREWSRRERAGRDVPLVSKERFDDFEGRRRIKSAESSGGMEERSGCRGVEETAREEEDRELAIPLPYAT